jgi:hypothetical protein
MPGRIVDRRSFLRGTALTGVLAAVAIASAAKAFSEEEIAPGSALGLAYSSAEPPPPLNMPPSGRGSSPISRPGRRPAAPC